MADMSWPAIGSGAAWDRALAYWRTLPSDPDAAFDREVSLDAAIGEREAAWLVAANAHTVSATVDGHALGPLEAKA